MSPTAVQNPTMQSHIQGIRFVAELLRRAVGTDLTDDQLVFTVGSSTSNIAWLVGHLAFSFDGLLGTALGLPPSMSPEQLEQFNEGDTPSTDPSDYPPVDELLAAAAAAVRKATDHLETLDDEVLAQPLPEGHPVAARFSSIGILLNALIFHTGYHTGQITLLRRAQGLAADIGARAPDQG